MSPAADAPRRGEVWWVGFGPSVGGEIRKRRPAVVVSNDGANKHLNRIQVVPITSSVARLFPSEAHVTLEGGQRKAMADQLATVGKGRLGGRLGRLDAAELKGVECAIRVQLGLEPWPTPRPDPGAAAAFGSPAGLKGGSAFAALLTLRRERAAGTGTAWGCRCPPPGGSTSKALVNE